MPRGPRLDMPRTFHHVMIRGIERGNIFLDDDGISAIGESKRRISFAEKAIGEEGGLRV